MAWCEKAPSGKTCLVKRDVFNFRMEAVVMLLSLELRCKARQAVDALVDGIGEELNRRARLDQVEKSLFRGLMELGKSLLQQAVDEVADEEVAVASESLVNEAGVALQRVERTPQRLVTVFGELRVRGPVYAIRRKQKIQRAPVDERLGLALPMRPLAISDISKLLA